MPQLSIIQPSFSGGEYSPSLYARVDIAKYQTGLRKCRNFIIHPHGGASNRPGTKYVADAKFSDKKCRVVKFIFSTDQAYVLEFGDLYVRFYTDQLPIEANVPAAWDTGTNYYIDDYVTYNSATYYAIQDSISQNPASATTYWTEQTIYEITTPYAVEDLFNLRFESSADVIYITHPDYEPMTLSRYANADWELDLFQPENGPFMPENVESTTLTPNGTTGSITINSSSAIFDDPLHEGALLKLRHYIEGQAVGGSFTATGTTSSIKCFTTWRVISHGTWTGTFEIEKSDDGGSTWTVLRTFDGKDDYNPNTYNTEDIETNVDPFLIRINMSAYTSGTCKVDLQSDPFYQEGIARITAVNSTTSVNATVIKTIGLASATTDWSEGSWSNYRGWPSNARFYMDRLSFSNTYSEPMTTWMSEIGIYDSFLRHTNLLDTDGISTNLPSRQLNAINGVVALRKLLALTSASEWTIGPTSSSSLTPTTVEQVIQGYRGSWGCDPAVVGNECIFIQANSKVVRNLSYSLGSDGYVGNDLNILARHLFENYTIVEIAYQQDPDSVVWCLRDDGILLGMSYLPEQEVVAWHWHDTGGGSNDKGIIESITTIPGQGFDELWMVVKRGDKRFIERMTQRLVYSSCSDGTRSQRLENSYFVDCGVTFGETPVRITLIEISDIIRITAPLHGFTDGMTIKLKNITDPAAITLNGATWTIQNSTTNNFELLAEV